VTRDCYFFIAWVDKVLGCEDPRTSDLPTSWSIGKPCSKKLNQNIAGDRCIVRRNCPGGPWAIPQPQVPHRSHAHPLARARAPYAGFRRPSGRRHPAV